MVHKQTTSISHQRVCLIEIISVDSFTIFWCPFLNSLDGREVCNRIKFMFHIMTLRDLNSVKKLGFSENYSLEVTNPGSVTFRRMLPPLSLNLLGPQ
jgi:hypothetical protein